MSIPDTLHIKVHTIDSSGQYQIYSGLLLDAGDYQRNPNGSWGYTNYEFYTTNKANEILDISAVNWIKSRYEKKGTQSLYKQTPVAKGCNLYIAPNSGVPLDDIRKHYNIKRTIDSSDYIVLSEDSILFDRVWTYGYFKWENQKFFLIINHSEGLKFLNNWSSDTFTLNDHAINELNIKFDLGLDKSYEANDLDSNNVFKRPTNTKRAALYRALLEQQTPKEYVYTSDLTLGSNVPLTLDMLKVVASAASQAWSQQAESALMAELAALNQTNWRNYKGTLSRYFYHYKTYGNVLSEISPSQVPIAVKPLMKECIDVYGTPFCGEDDYNMFMSWLCNETGIRDRKFLTRDEQAELEGIRLYNHPQEFYSMCIRVIPRTYQEYLRHTGNDLEDEDEE